MCMLQATFFIEWGCHVQQKTQQVLSSASDDTRMSIDFSKLFSIANTRLPNPIDICQIIFCYENAPNQYCFDLLTSRNGNFQFFISKIPNQIRRFWDVSHVNVASTSSNSGNFSTEYLDSTIGSGVRRTPDVSYQSWDPSSPFFTLIDINIPAPTVFKELPTNWVASFCTIFKHTNHEEFVKHFPVIKINNFFNKLHQMYPKTRDTPPSNAERSAFNSYMADLGISCVSYLEFMTRHHLSATVRYPKVSHTEVSRFYKQQCIGYIDTIAIQFAYFLTTVQCDHNKKYPTKILSLSDFEDFLGLYDRPFNQFGQFPHWHRRDIAKNGSITNDSLYEKHEFDEAF
jgi:hypothetical protein